MTEIDGNPIDSAPLSIAHHRLFHAGVSLHYVTAGTKGAAPLVLLPGFPQTWAQWCKVISRLAQKFHILAADLRGIGATPGPQAGYDKHAMAVDTYAITEKIFGDRPALVVGHDMGAFAAFGYALRYRARVNGLVLVDAPVPGTALFDTLKTHPRAWHIGFHGARDVAEMLVASRERAYIAQFIAARIADPAAITAADIDLYTAAYSAPGAMRAGFEWYRALEQDAAHNRTTLATEGRLSVPVLAVGGAASLSGALLGEMAAELSEDPRCVVLEGAAHWVPEEQPDALARHIQALAEEIASRGR
jgi:pimeloyl-ACP methyl ester carboxylesterase